MENRIEFRVLSLRPLALCGPARRQITQVAIERVRSGETSFSGLASRLIGLHPGLCDQFAWLPVSLWILRFSGIRATVRRKRE
jgi:hypothetical protein